MFRRLQIVVITYESVFIRCSLLFIRCWLGTFYRRRITPAWRGQWGQPSSYFSRFSARRCIQHSAKVSSTWCSTSGCCNDTGAYLHSSGRYQCFLFQKEIKGFSDNLIQKMFYEIMKTNIFQGELFCAAFLARAICLQARNLGRRLRGKWPRNWPPDHHLSGHKSFGSNHGVWEECGKNSIVNRLNVQVCASASFLA